MSFEEKNTWINGVLTAIVPAAYYLGIFRQAGNTPVAEIDYVPMMLAAVAVAVVLGIVGVIVVAIASPKEADKSDERDTNINRRGELVGHYVLDIGVVAILGLAMARVDHFWIANGIYLSFVLMGLTSSAVKLVAYRRGF